MRLLKVGRASNCDIVLRSDRASALHAEITILNNGDILLEDKNSRNGTFIMNRPIKPGTQVSIKRGDAIRFGDVELLWDQVPYPEDLSRFKAVYGIGKSMRNDIQIAGNTVSRYHATLKIGKDGKAFLQDHSSNGSTINGERLSPGQTRQVKRSDSIVCGGVPVNLSQFIPANPWPKIVGIAATIAVLVIGIWAAWTNFPWFPWNNTISPVTTQAMENASACVYGGYYFDVQIKDDPFKGMYSDEVWPSVWRFGWIPVKTEKGIRRKAVPLSEYPKANAFEYTGTAFFISLNGEMGTNRHIAVPWEYEKELYENDIRDYLANQRTKLAPVLSAYSGVTTELEWQARMNRLTASDINISGSHVYFGVGLTGSKINNILDLQQAQVIAESGDPKKDVALIRLNSRKTPDYIVEMEAIYDIENARVDERTLKPQDEELIITGYPMGEIVTNQTFDGKELRPTIHKAYLSKMPDDNQIQIQSVGIGGQSGSPVIDKSHRLVGVLCSGFSGTEVTYCCNIKHLVELYNKHRVRE